MLYCLMATSIPRPCAQTWHCAAPSYNIVSLLVTAHTVMLCPDPCTCLVKQAMCSLLTVGQWRMFPPADMQTFSAADSLHTGSAFVQACSSAALTPSLLHWHQYWCILYDLCVKLHSTANACFDFLQDDKLQQHCVQHWIFLAGNMVVDLEMLKDAYHRAWQSLPA